MKTVSIIYHPQDAAIARYFAGVLKQRGFKVRGVVLTSEFTADSVTPQLQAGEPVLVMLTPVAAAISELQWLSVSALQEGTSGVIPMMVAPVDGNYLFTELATIDATSSRQAALAELLRRLNRNTTPAQRLSRSQLVMLAGAAAALLMVVLLGVLAFATVPQDDVVLPTRFVSDTSVAIGGDDPAVVLTTEEATAQPSQTAIITEEATPLPTDIPVTEEAADVEDDYEEELYADFLSDPIEGPAPHTVTFENISSGPIEAYIWDFDGDGIPDSSEETPPPYTFELPGDYEITLTVLDAAGNTSGWTEYVYVYGGDDIAETVEVDDDGPTAFFSMNPYFGDAPLTVNFTNGSVGDIVSYAWDFNGDGAIDSTAQNPPSYTYTERREYTIRLTVEDALGDTDTMTDSLIVSDKLPPEVFFTVLPDYGVAPFSVSFSNSSSGEIDRYEWDFNGDGSVDSTSEIPGDYTFTEPGEYEVRLTAYGPGGRTTDSYFVFADTPEEPFVFMIPDPDFGTVPLTVTFDLEEYGAIDRYEWDFDGNGTVDSTAKNPPPYTYTEPGDYPVTLTAIGPGGTSTDSLTITVDPIEAPEADFDISPGFGTAPLTVTFNNYSYGSIDSYTWDFDSDGITDSTTQNPPPHTYTEPGTYTASLTVTGPGGITDTVTRSIAVDAIDPPFVILNASTYAGEAPLSVTFTQVADGEVSSYAWDFDGDGTTDSTAQNPPSYTYNTPGTYTASLTATGPGGTATDSIDIDVEESATVTGPAMLAATLTYTSDDADGSGDVTSNDVITYTATINNTGESAAASVAYTAPVPQHTTYIAGSTTLNGSATTDISGGPVTVGSIPAGGSAVITYRVRVNLPVPEGVSSVSTQGSVTAQELAAVLTDDPAEDTPNSPTMFPVRRTLPVLSATLVGILSDVDGSGGLTANDLIDYIVTVENSGTGPATSTEMILAVPQGTVYVPGSTFVNSQAAPDMTNGAVMLDTLRPGQRRVISFQVRASADLTGLTTVAVQASVVANPGISLLSDNPVTPEQGDATVINVQGTTEPPATPPTTTEEVTATTPAPVVTEEVIATTPAPVVTEEVIVTTPPVVTEEPVVITPTFTPTMTHTPTLTLTPTNTPTFTPTMTLTPTAPPPDPPDNTDPVATEEPAA